MLDVLGSLAQRVRGFDSVEDFLFDFFFYLFFFTSTNSVQPTESFLSFPPLQIVTKYEGTAFTL